ERDFPGGARSSPELSPDPAARNGSGVWCPGLPAPAREAFRLGRRTFDGIASIYVAPRCDCGRYSAPRKPTRPTTPPVPGRSHHMGISRRKLLQVAGTATVGTALGMHRQVFAQGAKKKLKILQWNHFVPGYDKWFNGEYIKAWGEKNDTEVTVDNVGIPALNPTAASEVSAKKGHDLFGFLWPRPVYENDVIDHKEIYEECEKK